MLPLLCVALFAVPAPAGDSPAKAEREPGSQDLYQASLEELMNIEVSTVSRKDQRLAQTAAAVFVITQDDIRRAGATSIPEALRLAPGVHVARIDSNKWAISARGFNGRFANKMLVLFDGRSVYTNLYSGVYWDQNDVMVEDIDRIEVIRGPGATMWGANAVNGVINVITKSAKATQGTLVSATAGTDEIAGGAVRYGGKVGEKVHYRLFTKSFRRRASLTEIGTGAEDAWGQVRGGGRVEWALNRRDALTLHGDVYEGRAGNRIYTNFPYTALGGIEADRVTASGGYGLARWTRRYSDRSELALQTYYSREDRWEGLGHGAFRTLDFDFQHRFALKSRHDLTWGLGYRNMSDEILVNKMASFDPPSRTDSLYSSFLQDDLSLVEDRLTLSFGSKFQHNAYSGFEIQPSARLAWTPTSRTTAWTAISRAVRTPSRKDHDLRLSFALPPVQGFEMQGMLFGDRSAPSETLNSYELGFRRQFGTRVSVDTAAFYSSYAQLSDWQLRDPVLSFDPPRILVPIYWVGDGRARSAGVESSVTVSLLPTWRLSGAHTYLNLTPLKADPPVVPSGFSIIGPRHQIQARSNLDLPHKLSIDAFAYHVSTHQSRSIPPYWRLDARLGWQPSEHFEWSIGGQNLLDDRHPEARSEDFVLSGEIRRAVYLRLSFRF